MKARYRGLELQSGSAVYPVLEVVSGWFEQRNGPADLLHRLRQAGFCFCETMYGCIACKGAHNVPRNEFEQNVPLEEEGKVVPLTLGVGGPVVGTAKIVNGQVVGEITDEDLVKQLQGDLSSFAIGRRDPAEKYRVRPQYSE